MARSTLTSQAITDTGLEETTEAANVDGNAITGDGKQILHLINASGGDIVATIVTGGTLQGKAVVDTTVTVTAGEERYIGRFNPALYNDPTTNLVNIDYDGVTSLTVAVLSI